MALSRGLAAELGRGDGEECMPGLPGMRGHLPRRLSCERGACWSSTSAPRRGQGPLPSGGPQAPSTPGLRPLRGLDGHAGPRLFCRPRGERGTARLAGWRWPAAPGAGRGQLQPLGTPPILLLVIVSTII